MNDKQLSKLLSLVLRHQPQTIGLLLDQYGWADVQDLLSKLQQKHQEINIQRLEAVVSTNDKQRFTFNDDKTKIRANQGHSIDIELGLAPVDPPKILYHGTAKRFIKSILTTGLNKRKRQHVHLSKDPETAIKVGQRHGQVIVLKIKAQAMQQDGFEFYLSKNGVWLCDNVPVKYIQYELEEV